MVWIATRDLDAGDFGICKEGEVYPLAKLGSPDGPEYEGGLTRMGYIRWVDKAPTAAKRKAPAKKKSTAKKPATRRKTTVKKGTR